MRKQAFNAFVSTLKSLYKKNYAFSSHAVEQFVAQNNILN